jgi:hypothetical protein
MAKNHNATGRTSNAHQSKAQRQAAMNPNNPRTTPSLATRETQAAAESGESTGRGNATAVIQANTSAPQTPATTEAPATSVVAFTGKGAAMKTRWSACLKARPGQKAVFASDIKVLSRESTITSLVAGNPKKQNAAKRYELYGFNMAKGATTTIGKYVEAVKKLGEARSASWATEGVAIADIAWDLNHGFISVTVPEIRPVDETNVAEVVAVGAETAEASHTELPPVETPAPESIPEIEGAPEELPPITDEMTVAEVKEAVGEENFNELVDELAEKRKNEAA